MIVRLEELCKSFDGPAGNLAILDKVSHTFPQGSSTAILGESGVGKSTLLYVLAGLDSVSSGRVLFNEFEMSSANDDLRSSFRAKNLGFVFQFHHLLPEFSALENVLLPSQILGSPNSESSDYAKYLLERVGMSERLDHRPHQLSGGERQRVALARALIAKPKLLIADEPTGSLDTHSAQAVRELLLSLQAEHGLTLIVVTHNSEFAKDFDHRLHMGVGGRLQDFIEKS